MTQINRRTDSPFIAQEESGLACLNKRQDLTSLLKLDRNPEIHVKLEKNPEFPVSTGDEDLFPCTKLRGITRHPFQLERKPDSTVAKLEVP